MTQQNPSKKLRAKRATEKARRLTIATKMVLEGRTQMEIAEAIGISQTTVSHMLRDWREEAFARAAKDGDEHAKLIILRNYHIYREAMEEWNRSKEDKEVRTVEKDRGKEKVSLRREGQTGNPALLEKALAALKAVREILGLDAAKPQEIHGPGGGPIQLQAITHDFDPSALTDDQLRQIEAQIAARIGPAGEGAAGALIVHEVHEAGLPDQLAPRSTGEETG